MSIYNTGTVAVTNGSPNVVGTGTGWAANLVKGGMLSVDGIAIPIASVTDDTHLTLAYNYPGTGGSGKAYAIALETAESALANSITTKLASVLARLIQSNANAVDPGILYTFDTGTTDADPGAGKIRANHASLASATMLYISKTTAKGSNVATYLNSLDDGTSAVKGRSTLTQTLTGLQTAFKIGVVTDATNYVKVAISAHSGETAFAADAPISFQFSETGDATTLSLLSMGVDDETDIASAATLNLTSGTPKTRRRVTGTTTITAITAGNNKLYILRFAGVLTLSHHSTNLYLPGAGNIVTMAGDVAIFVTDGSGNSRCIHYQRANGMPLLYSEGTWTPTISFSGAAVGVNYASRSGGYIVIGNLVHVWGRITLSSKGSSIGDMEIGGLPFAIGGTLGDRGAGDVGFINNGTSLPIGLTLGFAGGTGLLVRGSTATGTTSVTNSNVANNTEIQFSAVYSRA